MEALVFDIKRFAIHDGPGIRTTVFLKGCGLKCKWCHNPESISGEPELVIFREKCIGCGACVKVCPAGANKWVDGRVELTRELCTVCGECVKPCYTGARSLAGRRMSVEEVFDEIIRDKIFYLNSGGGMTLSGGEPLLQYEFCRELLSRCALESIHRCVDTSLGVPWRAVEAVAGLTDMFLIDIKHMDPDKHKQMTGTGNELIIENARRLARRRCDVLVRVPVIPGFNDTEEEIAAIAGFCRAASITGKIELMPYHRLGELKWSRLGRRFELEGIQPPGEEKMAVLDAAVRREGLVTCKT